MATYAVPYQLDLGAGQVSALLVVPVEPKSLYVMAHGAGAGMRHPFLADVAELLAARGVATLRYQFPYMESGRGRPDSPAVATATVRAAVAFARREFPSLPLMAGGKSFGGRMTSTAAADGMIPEAGGLVFLGFPLHPPNRPGVVRGDHLERVRQPMLFLQGTRDDLADLTLMRDVTDGLGSRATLHVVDGANHSFQVPKSSGRSGQMVLAELADAIAQWAGERSSITA